MKKSFLNVNHWNIALILFVFIFISCGDDDETVDEIDDDFAPLSVEFTTSSMFLEVTTTNLSINGMTYAWDFGVENSDADTSTEFEPTFIYEVADTYTIMLTVTGEGGQEDTFSSDITVTEEMINPSASFTSEISALTVNFTNTSENGETFAWDFGDDIGTSTDENPTYTYAEAGTFTVSLTTTSATGNTDVATEDITVALASVTPEAQFTFVAEDLEVTFTNASEANDGNITAFAWEFGDAENSTSTDENPVFTYTEAGDFDVTLTVTFDELDGVTTATTTETVTVTALPAEIPEAQFTFVAQDLEVTFTNTSVANDGNITAFAWEFGDAENSTSTDENPVFTYTEAGDFDVTLTITFDDLDGISTATTTQTITVTDASGGGDDTSTETFAAIIRDTNGSDTGELRFDIEAALTGRFVVTFTRTAEAIDTNTMNNRDGFISLLNNSGSTSNEQSILDLRVRSNEFEIRDQSFEITNVTPTPGTLQTAVITWNAPDATTSPTVTVEIDGVPVSSAYVAGSGATGGVERIQFRFGDNGSIISPDSFFTIESFEVFSDTAGTTSIFATDFSEFSEGESLAGGVGEFNGNSSDVTVEVIED